MKTLHIISHTHWDREWYLTFQQFRLKLVHLIDKLLDILEADPNFKYFMLDGQTIVLMDYLLIRPEMEPILRGHTEIALTLLRAVGWLSRDDMSARQGHAGPAFETPGGQVQGKAVFDYSIIPHAGDGREARQLAYAFQTELRAIETGIHPGEIPAQGSFVSSSPESFIISAVKATENGTGWLVRGYNISPEPIRVSLNPLRRFARAAQVNLAEEEIAPLVENGDGQVEISVAGHQIVSVMFSD